MSGACARSHGEMRCRRDAAAVLRHTTANCLPRLPPHFTTGFTTGPNCRKLLELVLAVKRDELHRGARPELHALMDVPGVSLWVARALYDAGLHSPEMLMKLDTTTVGWGFTCCSFLLDVVAVRCGRALQLTHLGSSRCGVRRRGCTTRSSKLSL